MHPIKVQSVIVACSFLAWFGRCASAEVSKWQEYKTAGEQAEIEHDYNRAEYWYGRALSEAEKGGASPAQMEETLTRSAGSYVLLDKLDKAEPLYQRAMNNAFGDKSTGQNPEYLVWLDDLADDYSSRDTGPNTEICLKHAIDIRQKISGGKHTKLAPVLYKLSEYYANNLKWSEALPYAKRALASFESMQGRVNINTAQCYMVIGEAYRGLHQYKESLEAFNKSLQMLQKLVPGSTFVACVYRLEGEVARDQKQWSDAEAFYKQALAVDQKVDGQHGLYEFADYNSLADFYEKRGDLQKAEHNYRIVVELFAARLGANNVAVANSNMKLALVLRKMHRNAEADKLEAQARSIMRVQPRKS
jgi:tetratricopeptide (TPR) repeat protein